ARSVREFPHQNAFSNRSYWRNCDWVPICLASSYEETKMKPALIGAAAVAAAAFATPALAQTIIEDPGYCAQFYPDANCQNLGAGNPYTDGGYWRNANADNAYSPLRMVHHRHPTHRG